MTTPSQTDPAAAPPKAPETVPGESSPSQPETTPIPEGKKRTVTNIPAPPKPLIQGEKPQETPVPARKGLAAAAPKIFTAADAGTSSSSLFKPTPAGQPAQPAPIPPAPQKQEKTGGTSLRWRKNSLSQTHTNARTSDDESALIIQERAQKLGPGVIVGHYELIRLLGEGGMGAVYLARDNRLGRRVAIKFLHTNDEHQTRRFILEARMTARCGHENIVVIYEADEFQGAPYMVLEFLKGSSLQDMLQEKRGPMPVGRVAELMVPVLRALTCAHEAGIVHRDLKPDNIFVTQSGTVKVLDFGISKVLQDDDSMADRKKPDMGEDDDENSDLSTEELASIDELRDLSEESASLTVAGSLMGTIPYMAPEQWRARSDIDAAADIWAIGIILYKMLSGQHPLPGVHGMNLAIVGNYKVPMPSLAVAAPDLPEDLIAIVDRCLLKRRAQRWPSAQALLEALEKFLPGRSTRAFNVDECPYAGLSAFQENDADRFFGRDAEISALVNMIREQPLVGIAGASGAGKSSIVRAGVVPALKRSGEKWVARFIRPGRTPLLALAEAIVPPAQGEKAAERVDAVAFLAKTIASEPGKAGALLRSEARIQGYSLLLFVDQFEELFTQGISTEERTAFTACLSSIADDASSPTRVVLSLRADFLDRVSEDRRFLSELSQGLFFLTAPGRDSMRDAILEPARLAGFKFENAEIVEDMLDHLASTQGALPLLQFAASKLWDARDKKNKLLTESGYDEMGGIAGALATHADSVVRDLPAEEQKEVRALFLRLVSSERTRALVPMDDLLEQASSRAALEELINRLVQARLLVVQTSGGVTTVEIVHESLISSWPTLRRWLDESGEDVAFLEQLRTAAKQWESKSKSKDLLWRGDLVDEARRFKKRFRGSLSASQDSFLKASFALQTHTARLKRGAFAAGAVILLAFSGSMAFLKAEADNERIEAERQRIEAERQKTIAVAAKEDADKQRDIAEKRLKEIEEKEKARLAAQAEADENARVAREQEARALEEAKRAQAEEARRLEEMRKKESAEAEARLAQEKRAQAEAQARLEAEKKQLAEERAKTEAAQRAEAQRQAQIEAEKKRQAEARAQEEAKQRAEAERQARLEAEKKRQAEAAAEKARKEKERLDAEKAARKARIGAIDPDAL